MVTDERATQSVGLWGVEAYYGHPARTDPFGIARPASAHPRSNRAQLATPAELAWRCSLWIIDAEWSSLEGCKRRNAVTWCYVAAHPPLVLLMSSKQAEQTVFSCGTHHIRAYRTL